MKLFPCSHCANLVYYESHQCVRCGHVLAYLPDRQAVASLDPQPDGTWTTPAPAASRRTYRLCANYSGQQICNWAVPADSPHALCDACRLTQIIPELAVPGNHNAWYKLEVAKRRVLQNLTTLGLTWVARADDAAQGLAFEFLADPPGGGPPVMTSHVDGVITISLAEADDAERERRRTALREQYRTLVGHFRHEIGHYYWDRLVRDGGWLDAFRARFGDERADYAMALNTYYAYGAPANWPDNFVAPYASAHPWEDWAVTWAHYLHMVDALETAESCNVKVSPLAGRRAPEGFARMVDDWRALTHMLNNLNRSLGLNDAYPFVLSPQAIEKMRFVHDLVSAAGERETPVQTLLPMPELRSDAASAGPGAA